MGDMTSRQEFLSFKINFGDFSQKKKGRGGKRDPKLFSSALHFDCPYAPWILSGFQNSQLHCLEQSSRCVRWEAMCCVMNIECLHSIWSLILSLWLSQWTNETFPNTLHETSVLSYAELSSYLLFDTFLMRVVLGDGLNLIKTLNLSMEAFHHTCFLNSKRLFHLFFF